MKVIYLPNNTASLMTTMIPNMRRQGVTAVGFNFAPRIIQDTKYIENFPTTGNPLLLGFKQAWFLGLFLYHLCTADTVHWIYGSCSVLAGFILKFVAFFKRNKFVEYCGTDIRSLEKLCLDVDMYSKSFFSEQSRRDLGTEETSKETQRKFESHGFIALPNSPELVDYIDTSITTKYYEVSRSVDLDRFPYVGVNLDVDVPLVVHIPSNPLVKGTSYVMEAFKKLESEGLIRYQMISGVSHERSIELLKESDIVVDQLIIGEYGVLSIEALALGKPVICFIRPKLLKLYQEKYPGFPIISANIGTVGAELRRLVNDKSLRSRLSSSGRTYVENVHDGKRNAETLISIYNKNPKSIFRPSFLQVSKIASTSILVQGIAFFFYPIIGRKFTPEEFGTFAFFSSLTVIVSIVATGQYHQAVVNPDDEQEAHQLISISAWCSLVVTSFIMGGILLYFALNDWNLSQNWIIFPFYLLAYSLFEILRMACVRAQNYNAFNISQVINRLGSNSFKISGPTSWGSGWLIISEVLCYLLANGYLLFQSNVKILSLKQINWSVANKYSSFPIFQSSSLLIQYLISEFPSIYFKSIGDIESLGFYSMGNRLFIQPCILIGNSLHPVLIHKFKKNTLFNKGKFFVGLGSIGVVSFVVAYFLHVPIIHLLIGDQWVEGERIYKLQIFLILSKFFIGSLLSFYVAYNKPHILMIVRGLELVVIISAIQFTSAYFLDLYIACELIGDLALMVYALNFNRYAKN